MAKVYLVGAGPIARERKVESPLGVVARGKVDVHAPAVMVIGEVAQHRTSMKQSMLAGAAA